MKMSDGIGGCLCVWLSAEAASYAIAPSAAGAVFGRGCVSRGWAITRR